MEIMKFLIENGQILVALTCFLKVYNVQIVKVDVNAAIDLFLAQSIYSTFSITFINNLGKGEISNKKSTS